jgi:hypothetical protein
MNERALEGKAEEPLENETLPSLCLNAVPNRHYPPYGDYSLLMPEVAQGGRFEFLTALKWPVIPSEARNLALLRKQCEIPRFARNDKLVSWFLGARQPTGSGSPC